VCSLALPWVSVLTRSRFWQFYQRLRNDNGRLLYAPPEDVHLSNLRSLLAHAYNSVPFYRERIQAVRLDPDTFSSSDDLRRLPPTTKADIIANFPDQITSSPRVFPPWRYVSTSGTIERLTAIHDFRKRDFVRASQLLGLSAPTRYRP